MKVIKVEIVATSGANKHPASGYATFDDGKTYSFHWHPIYHRWVFFTWMKQSVGSVQKSFQSTPRDAALSDYFS